METTTNSTHYKVTRKFTSGILEGLEHTEISTVSFPVGFECKQPIGGSPYVITECKPAPAPKIRLVCNECGRKFSVSPNAADPQCPKCGGVDWDVL